jgi:nitrite reductase/ring-hydroxylating ferredoxin subunit
MNDAFFETGVAATDLQAGKAKRTKVNGLQVLLIKTESGVHAYTPICPHANGDLTYGAVFDDVVECPLHGWRFSIKDGACVDDAGGGTLRTFAVELRDGHVFVEIQRPKWMDD